VTTRTSRGAAVLPSLARWTAACAIAEAVGMTAAAAAARASQAVAGGSPTGWLVLAALAVIVAGGLVEGTALGYAQSTALRPTLPRAARRNWVILTVTVAGLGWAAASAPATFAGDGDPAGTDAPALPLVLVMAGLLGAGMGALLGAAQALALRGHVRHPWRWITASTVGWTPAMAVIFVGATSAGAGWSPAAVVALGAGTGLAAGAVLGVVSGWFLPSLDGAGAADRAVLALLSSRFHRAAGRSLLGLRVRGVRTGRAVTFPVAYARGEDLLVVLPGRPDTKRWWRNLVVPAEVGLLLDGRWTPGHAGVVRPGERGYDEASATYQRRRPRVHIPPAAPLVVIRRDGAPRLG